jgi:surface polysaccharide O-acyltransferase-like enzyme
MSQALCDIDQHAAVDVDATMTIVAPSPPPTKSTPGARDKSDRLILVDAVRLLGALAIVWIHVPRSAQLQPTTILARFAVPTFTVIAVLLVFDGFRLRPDRSWWSFARSRIGRIYPTFLGWTVIYLLFKLCKKAALPEQENCFPGIEILWTGSAYHLWFLPFILAVSLAAGGLAAVANRNELARHAIVVAGLLGGLAVACSDSMTVSNRLAYARLVADAIPAALIAVSLGAMHLHRGLPRIRSRSLFTAVVALFVAEMAMLGYIGRNALLENLAGTTLALAALARFSPSWLMPAARLGPCAFGVYCSHLLFIKIGESVANNAHWPVSPGADLALLAASVIASFLCAWLLSLSDRTRWLAI